MPFIKISGLTTATAVSATNQFEINQNGGSRSATVAQVAAFARTSATDPVVLPAGTVSAPGITFTGDTNTGIYSPAADTIAFTEGGVEAMRLDASGNVGIGTSSPASYAGANDRVLTVFNVDQNITLGARYQIGVGQLAFINSGNANNTGATNLALMTGGVERMLIGANGNVGIGTSSPGSPLTITNASANPLLALNATGTQDNAIQLARSGVLHGAVYQENAGALNVRNFTAQPIVFWTNNTEQFRVGPAGQLGVGGANYGTSGQVLTSNGAAAAPSWQNAGGTPNGLLLNVQVFTSSGTYTRTAGATRAVVIAVGGGGGSGGVAMGGAAPNAGNGGTGGTTSFGSHVSAGGGLGSSAVRNSAGNGGGGGSGGSGALISLRGQPGGVVGTAAAGGNGGGTGGGLSGNSGVRGGGGGGAYVFDTCIGTGATGGGGQGETAIDYISSGLGATETVTIGAGGTAGSAGSSGSAGTAGGAGYIIVYEYS